MKNIFTRKKLLTERKRTSSCIGYARGSIRNPEYLNEQIQSLKEFGCDYIFSETLSLIEEQKPQLSLALNKLCKGDQIVVTKLDRVFKSRYECITTINKLLNKGIYFCTISGSNYSHDFPELYSIILNILLEIELFEKDISKEKKREIADNILLKGKNIGGRPKTSNLKEELVVRLRKEGFSYRSIRSQTGIALSTIRRIIVDYSS